MESLSPASFLLALPRKSPLRLSKLTLGAVGFSLKRLHGLTQPCVCRMPPHTGLSRRGDSIRVDNSRLSNRIITRKSWTHPFYEFGFTQFNSPLSLVVIMLALLLSLLATANTVSAIRQGGRPLLRRQDGPTDPGIHKLCTFWDTAVDSSATCDYFETTWSITHEDFVFWVR